MRISKRGGEEPSKEVQARVAVAIKQYTEDVERCGNFKVKVGKVKNVPGRSLVLSIETKTTTLKYEHLVGVYEARQTLWNEVGDIIHFDHRLKLARNL